MAAIENHQNKNKKQFSKWSHLAKKGYTYVSRSSSGKPLVVLGGVIHVQIRSTRKADGGYHINLKKVTSRTKNSHGVFVAGGSEIDRLVASANANVPSLATCVSGSKKKVEIT
jgi:hypothetical protein